MKAIALYSGGLDSTLAIGLMLRAGINIIPVHFTTPFGGPYVDGRNTKKETFITQAFGLSLRHYPLDAELLALVKQPQFGWGKNLNPCIDCHLLMLQKTKTLMSESGADFVVTGEVLGQRPMSQHRQALELIARRSGLGGLLLRPLSARLLAPTVPEEKGWIKREHLLDLSGRSRKPQLALAQKWGIDAYQPPAGGCLLTDAGYSRKLKNLLDSDMLNSANCQVIRWGRFFNLDRKCKLVVARNEQECHLLKAHATPEDVLLKPTTEKGPTALLRGEELSACLEQAIALVAYYCRPSTQPEIEIQTKQHISCRRSSALPEDQVRALLIG